MGDRYTLSPKLDRLRAILAKSERRMHLSQDVRSSDLYQAAEDTIDKLIADIQTAIAQADSTRPAGT